MIIIWLCIHILGEEGEEEEHILFTFPIMANHVFETIKYTTYRI